MRALRFAFATLAAGWMAFAAPLGVRAEAPAEPKLGANGLYVQPWFLESFLELREDLEEAAAKGKRFVIFWEQKGCPYCKETHVVNLAKPEIAGYIQKHFVVLQLDLYGSRKVKDFDGEELAESALARKWGIRFTPTVQFFPPKLDAAKKNGKELEVARLPGYLKPFPFYVMFQFVEAEAYKTVAFRDFYKKKHQESVAAGSKAHTW
jgi:thioredoxin-related protein